MATLAFIDVQWTIDKSLVEIKASVFYNILYMDRCSLLQKSQTTIESALVCTMHCKVYWHNSFIEKFPPIPIPRWRLVSPSFVLMAIRADMNSNTWYSNGRKEIWHFLAFRMLLCFQCSLIHLDPHVYSVI